VLGLLLRAKQEQPNLLHLLTAVSGTGQKLWAAQQLRQQSRGTTDMLSGCPACLPLTPQPTKRASALCAAAIALALGSVI